MKEFIRKYEDRIHGVLSCFDRMIFRGYLPNHVGLGDGSIPRPFKSEFQQS